MSWIQGKTIILWGCGAIGGHAAEWLARAGAKKLILCDSGVVTPGILVRQLFREDDIGTKKVEALAERLKSVRAGIDIELHSGNILDAASYEQISTVDLILDSTGNRSLSLKLESLRKQNDLSVPLAAMMVGHQATRGMSLLSMKSFSGGPYDVLRKLKLVCGSDSKYLHYLNEFWPENRRPIFQPEPGCSDPTFVGSAVDICGLVSNMLNLMVTDLGKNESKKAFTHLLTSPTEPNRNEGLAHFERALLPDTVSLDPDNGFEMRIAPSVLKEIKSWIRKSVRETDLLTETGGVLFGEIDELLETIWISDLLGPPSDSSASHQGFNCGTQGVSEYEEYVNKRSRGSVRYLGMWHTHPGGEPVPSPTDFEAMRTLVENYGSKNAKTVMLIVGGSVDNIRIGAYVFSDNDFHQTASCNSYRPCAVTIPSAHRETHRIGLALSGGGSRAIAFHLGCMRALNDYGILEDVEVISTVSGGAVIGAMYAYRDDDFESFEEEVLKLLRSGLAKGIAIRFLFWPPRFVLAIPMFLLNLGWSWVFGILMVLLSITGVGKQWKIPPLPRLITRTNAFVATLGSSLFGDKKITDQTRKGMSVVISACELRTGSAFRFGNRESGSWRFGKVEGNDVALKEAVAASAAYPIFLPAIDKSFPFIDKKNEKIRERVILTDGGIYDNLGVTCLLPGRSKEISYNTYSSERIICCAAGAGLFSPDSIPTRWFSRISRSFAAVHRKAQDAHFSMLHQLRYSGEIEKFILPYLGQIDECLPYQPPDLVKRQEVIGYPTDFFGMKEENIEKLAKRGEQLTRLLIKAYKFDE